MGGIGAKMVQGAKPDELLAIIEAVMSSWENSGQTFSWLNLDPTRTGLGIVLDNAYKCEKCHHLFIRGEGHVFHVCPDCRGRV